MVSKLVVSPSYKWDILGWTNPLIRTFDPNFLSGTSHVQVGKDAFRFEAAFGPQWQLVWREIVREAQISFACSIWWCSRMRPVAPPIVNNSVNNVSYETRINHESHFSWQAQYLVMLEGNLWLMEEIPRVTSGLVAVGIAGYLIYVSWMGVAPSQDASGK